MEQQFVRANYVHFLDVLEECTDKKTITLKINVIVTYPFYSVRLNFQK